MRSATSPSPDVPSRNSSAARSRSNSLAAATRSRAVRVALMSEADRQRHAIAVHATCSVTGRWAKQWMSASSWPWEGQHGHAGSQFLTLGIRRISMKSAGAPAKLCRVALCAKMARPDKNTIGLPLSCMFERLQLEP